MSDAQPTIDPARVRQALRVMIWLFWCCGPGPVGACWIGMHLWPVFFDRNFLVMVVLMYAHAAAAVLGLLLLFNLPMVWRWPEAWLVGSYGLGLAAVFVPMATDARGLTGGTFVPGFVTMLIAAFGIPLVAIVRRLRRRRATTRIT